MDARGDDIEDWSDEALAQIAREAGEQAVQTALARGVSVFYIQDGVFVREDPDGRRFEVRHHEQKRGAYEIVRELT
jgi:hypothetical protein